MRRYASHRILCWMFLILWWFLTSKDDSLAQDDKDSEYLKVKSNKEMMYMLANILYVRNSAHRKMKIFERL